ncbi:hypothetical protein M595_0303 [Lyngbya aestuarii BL J]|uniref:Uncharacterized protein n=1 Tax=Lyngbya aestuarii BL J TaxID=1348334 RepID=U7QPG0_9CYAN|nr:hypothetical protein M595_0303 [Lyngbya aestuarii BL J]
MVFTPHTFIFEWVSVDNFTAEITNFFSPTLQLSQIKSKVR